MEAIDVKPKRKRQANPDRIVLDTVAVAFVKTVAAQLEEVFGGVIKLTTKEIANFILQSRTEALSTSELKEIRDKHFDDVKALQWATQKVKEAKAVGNRVSLADLLAQIQVPVAPAKRAPRTPKAKSEKVPGETSHTRTKTASSEAPSALKTGLE